MPYNVTFNTKSGVEEEEGGFWLLKWPLLGDWLGIGLSVGSGEGFPLHCFFSPAC